jgi:Rieske Fe-S protein
MTELDHATAAATATADPTTSEPTRRQVLVTGGAVVAAAALTAACGSSGSSSAAATGAGGTVTLATSDIPVGGGKVLDAQHVVVTQPTAGTFKAFNAVCTHQGCTVASVANGLIVCPCHNSQFSAADGSVQSGPAPAPLASVALTVSGATITVQA